ncbi:Zinc finger, CCHC-type [Sergentomyia squamirostris]
MGEQVSEVNTDSCELNSHNDFPELRGGKRRRKQVGTRCDDLPLFGDHENEKRYLEAVCVEEGKVFRNISSFAAKREFKRVAGNVISFSPMKNGNVLIVAKNVAQAERLRQITEISKKKVKIDYHQNLNQSKGVIACWDWTQLQDDELKEELKPEGIIDLKRIKRKNNDKKNDLIDTGTFILTFNRPTPPKELGGYYRKLTVRIFVRNPVQCKGCLKWGHFEDKCKSKVKICAKCAAPRHDGECQIPMQCSNCHSANHDALCRKCPFFLKEFRILQIKAEKQVSYFEAKKMYIEENKTKVEFSKMMTKARAPAATPPQVSPPNPFALDSNNGVAFQFQAPIERSMPLDPTEEPDQSQSTDTAKIVDATSVQSPSIGNHQIETATPETTSATKSDAPTKDSIGITGSLVKSTSHVLLGKDEEMDL